MNFGSRFRAVLLGCSSVLALGIGNAHAAIDEIVVTTAQRGADDIQTVPSAVTVFTATALEEAAIFESRDLQYQVPGLQVRDEPGPGGLTFAIRGINVSADNFSFDSAVGYYQNEVFVARSNDFVGSYFDVGSVEVLRGPQGIYFGRNTPAGAILVETARPGDTAGEGYLNVKIGGGGGDLGNGQDRFFYRAEGGVDLASSEKYGVRIAGFYENDSGWARQVGTPGKTFDNYSKDDFGVRGTVEMSPVESLKLTGVLEYTDFVRGGALSVMFRNGGVAVPPPIDKFETNEEWMPDNNGNTASATLIADYEVSENWNLRFINGWRDIERRTYTRSDGTPAASGGTDNGIGQEQISSELILSGPWGERVDFLGGLYYIREAGYDYNILTSGTKLAGDNIVNSSKAVFANLSFRLTDELTFSAGGRYSKEDKFLVTDSKTGGGTVLTNGPFEFNDNVSLYEVRLDWQPNDDVMFYIKSGTGYRAGGIGFRADNAIFEPETAESIEVGSKIDFELGGIPQRLNTAIYTSSYDNFQVPVVILVGGSIAQTVVNAGSATIRGLEMEYKADLTDNFNIGATFTLTDGGYDQFIYNDLLLGGTVDITDNKLRGIPDWAFSLNGTYTVPVNYGEWKISASYAYQDETETDTVRQSTSPGALNTPEFAEDAFGNLNLRIGLNNIHGSNVSVALWARNLTDELWKPYSLAASGRYYAVYNEPRAIGLELKADF